VTFGMKIGEVIGWEPAEAGSFSSLSILSFFLVHANFLIQKITQTAGIIAMGDIGSVRWKFTLEASFTKYSFCMERLKCSSSVWYWGLKKKKTIGEMPILS